MRLRAFVGDKAVSISKKYSPRGDSFSHTFQIMDDILFLIVLNSRGRLWISIVYTIGESDNFTLTIMPSYHNSCSWRGNRLLSITASSTWRKRSPQICITHHPNEYYEYYEYYDYYDLNARSHEPEFALFMPFLYTKIALFQHYVVTAGKVVHALIVPERCRESVVLIRLFARDGELKAWKSGANSALQTR